jgi:hypothetical protein
MTLERFARGVLGAYLLVHFVMLLPYASELFGSAGMLARPEASPFFGHIPNPLFTPASTWLAPALIGVACVLSVLFAIGAHDRGVAIVLWVIWMWLYTRNPLIANPSLPFIGLILLAHACLGGAVGDRRRWLSAQGAVFVVMAIAYSYSGWTKLESASWIDGSALRHVLENPLARPGVLRDALLATPDWVLQAQTYGVLAFELAFAVLCLHGRGRVLASSAMIVMHLGIVALVDFADLSAGMLMVHLYTSPLWAPSAARSSGRDRSGPGDARRTAAQRSYRDALA